MRGYKLARRRRLSHSGLEFIASWEGFIPTAYLDTLAAPAVWTIGYGHTGEVREGDTITRAGALRLLRHDARYAADAVRQNVRVQVTQHMFDALVSFTYNLGPGSLGSSTLLRLLNANQYEAAAREFPRWDMAGGVHIEGLRRRRMAEAALFRKPPRRFP